MVKVKNKKDNELEDVESDEDNRDIPVIHDFQAYKGYFMTNRKSRGRVELGLDKYVEDKKREIKRIKKEYKAQEDKMVIVKDQIKDLEKPGSNAKETEI